MTHIRHAVALLLSSIFAFVLLLGPMSAAQAGQVWVAGYCKKKGRCVRGHWRSSPDKDPSNNWSYPGNTNPITGKVASGSVVAYVRNLYDAGTSSPDKSAAGRYSLPTLVPLNSFSSLMPAQESSATPEVISALPNLAAAGELFKVREAKGRKSHRSYFVYGGMPGSQFN